MTETAPGSLPYDREADWTIDPETGRSNSSPLYRSLCAEVERLIRDGAAGSILRPEWVRGKAALVMAQLAHVHHLAPAAAPAEPPQPAS